MLVPNLSLGEKQGGGDTGGTPTLSPTGHLVVAVCLGFIGINGFLSNLLVLVLFCRYKVLRSPINCLLMSISASDMLVCVLGTPFSFAASTQGRWLLGHTGCVWYGFVNSCLGEFPAITHLSFKLYYAEIYKDSRETSISHCYIIISTLICTSRLKCHTLLNRKDARKAHVFSGAKLYRKNGTQKAT